MIIILPLHTLQKDYDIHHWVNYRPYEKHYETFEPHIIYACHKIIDVYYAFASARSYLSDYDCDNFGELISEHDDTHLRYIRSKCLQSALSHYNYAIDVSWQVVWFYIGDNSFLFMENQGLYEKYSNLCTEKNLYFKLDVCKFNNIKNHLKSFFNSDLVTDLRETYNYVKHRGSLHTEDLGEEPSHYYMTYKVKDYEYKPKMITRRSFNLEEFRDQIVEFDVTFCKYFEHIIDWIVPENFTSTRGGLFIPEERYNFHVHKMKDYEKSFLNHINNFYDKNTLIVKIKQDLNKYVEN